MMINVEEEISKLNARVAALEQLVNQSSVTVMPGMGVKKMSIKEFMLSKTIKSSSQAVLVAAYYLEKFSQYASFNIMDLTTAFQSAKETAPGNINDMVNKLIRQGLVMKANEKKDDKLAWVLTNSGERAVEECVSKK